MWPRCGWWIQTALIFLQSSHRNTKKAHYGNFGQLCYDILLRSLNLGCSNRNWLFHNCVQTVSTSFRTSPERSMARVPVRIIWNLDLLLCLCPVVREHQYWNYTVTLMTLMSRQLIKHAGSQTQIWSEIYFFCSCYTCLLFFLTQYSVRFE